MRHRILLALTMVLLAGRMAADDGIENIPVHFAPGESSAELTGQVQGHQTVDYVLGARAGQVMTATFAPDSSGAYFNLVPPGSDPTALHKGMLDGDSFAVTLPYDGDYRLRVYLSRGAADNGESAAYTIQVNIAGAPLDGDHPPPAFGPAEWDARGALPCGTDSAAFGGPSCDFKVLRFPGGATFWVLRPDGSTRIIYFDDEAFSSDSAAAVTATRDDDTWTVQIEGPETYLIPDVAIIGDNPY
ncbi:MAG: hypothetical protein KDA50_04260 [Rhodobacteraceae bacterium]|nr:hypothetical protein [Paracoccaceae bacterium]